MSVAAAVAGLLLAGHALALPAPVAAARAAAGAGTREAALAALADTTDPAARQRGARALGEAGTMADLPALAAALRDPDPLVRALAEDAMWKVWSRSGDEETDRTLAVGIELMTMRQLPAAIEMFSRVVQRRPEFAEGWNKRATAYYLAGEYEKSLADCHEVLKRNAYHFGALSGFGMIYLELNQPARALEYFERALAVNPNLRQVEEAAEDLRQLLRERRRNTI